MILNLATELMRPDILLVPSAQSDVLIQKQSLNLSLPYKEK